jgi:hypothetical protein
MEKQVILGKITKVTENTFNFKTGKVESRELKGKELEDFIASQEHEPRQEDEDG